MTDLHTHILPSIDDGPRFVEESVRLVRMELSDGVGRIALTPHFHCGGDSLDAFVQKRQQSLDTLNSALSSQNITVELVEGAEVAYQPGKLEASYRRDLCYHGTDYMLVELPIYYKPSWLMDGIEGLLNDGVMPVLAHVERYNYLLDEPQQLYEIVRMGVLAQVNAGSLLSGGHGARAGVFRAMEHSLVHLIATDTHSPDHRPPMLREALNIVADRYGSDKAAYFIRNSEAVLDNREPDLFSPRYVKRPFWYFRGL